MSFEVEALMLKSKVRYRISKVLGECPKRLALSVEKYAPVLSGSAISSIYHQEVANDFDFYFKTAENIDDVRTEYSGDGEGLVLDWAEYNDMEQIPLIPGKAVTNNAITFCPTEKSKYKMQFILRNTLNECRKNFDFIHCMPAYDVMSDILYISEAQLDAIREKRLIVNAIGPDFVPDSKRVLKFMKRGWKFWA